MKTSGGSPTRKSHVTYDSDSDCSHKKPICDDDEAKSFEEQDDLSETD
jgi:hypothetical protein